MFVWIWEFGHLSTDTSICLGKEDEGYHGYWHTGYWICWSVFRQALLCIVFHLVDHDVGLRDLVGRSAWTKWLCGIFGLLP
jgi:hypothetical protein